MRTHLPCILFPLMATTAGAQCVSAIPANAIVASGNGELVTANNSNIWICAGSTIYLQGDNNQVYAEDGGNIGVYGDNNTVRTRSDITVDGDYNMIWKNNMVLVTFIGDADMTTELHGCPDIQPSYTYDQAPATNCFNLSVEATPGLAALRFAPNPVVDHLLLTVPSGITVRTITVSDMSGRVALAPSWRSGAPLDVRALPSGPYVLTITTEQGTVARPLLKH